MKIHEMIEMSRNPLKFKLQFLMIGKKWLKKQVHTFVT